jgi:hypothetical protein
MARLPEGVREDLLAHLKVLQKFGPDLGRPTVDTLKASKHVNMKELRFNCEGGVWRFAFAFDVQRRAVVLCGDDKAGANEDRFYKTLIRDADDRFEVYRKRTEKEDAGSKRGTKKSAGKSARPRRGKS